MEPISAPNRFERLVISASEKQNHSQASTKTKPPGHFEQDFPFDKVLQRLIKLGVLDREGRLDRYEYFLTPFLEQPEIDELYKFYTQTVPYFLIFDEKEHEAARKYFSSPKRRAEATGENAEEALNRFLKSTLMTSTAKDVQYFICPKELFLDLYNFSIVSLFMAGIKSPFVSLEIVGGHARQFLHQAPLKHKSWAERFFEHIVKRPLREIVPDSIIEKFKRSPPDSDDRFVIPQANLKLLDELRHRVTELIASQVAAQYPEYKDKELFPYLIEFIKQFGLEKFSLVNTNENVFSIASFGQKTSKNLELLFVQRLQRSYMFTLDALKIPITPLIDFSTKGFFNGIKPYTKGRDDEQQTDYAFRDAQCLIDQYTNVLYCPNPETANSFVFFAGLFHQCKGARYLMPNTESFLLNKVLSPCESLQGSGRKAKTQQKKYDGQLVVNTFTHHLQKHLKNHASHAINAHIAFVLRALTVLQKHEKDIPANAAKKVWKNLAEGFKNCKNSSAKLFPLIAKTLSDLDGDFLPLHLFLQVATFIFLSHTKSESAPFQAYVTMNSGELCFLLESEYTLLIPCEVNQAADLLISKLTTNADAVLSELFHMMKPSQATDFSRSAPIEAHLPSLNINLKDLETTALKYLNTEFLTLKRMGLNLLFSCYSLSKNRGLIPLILEAIPSLLVTGNRKFSHEKVHEERERQEALLTECERLMQHARWIPQGHAFSETRKKIKEKREFLVTSSFAEDLIRLNHPELGSIGWNIWSLSQSKLIDKEERKASLIQFLTTFAANTSLAISAYRLLLAEKSLSSSEILNFLDLLLRKRGNTQIHSKSLAALCDEVIPKFLSSPEKTTQRHYSSELPRFIDDLMDEGSVEEATKLAYKSVESSLAVRNSDPFVKIWLRLCQIHLARRESLNTTIELFEDGQRLGVLDPKVRTKEFIDLQLGILKQLIASGEAKIERKILNYIAALAENEIDLETKNLLREIVKDHLFRAPQGLNWEKIEQETRRYQTLFDQESLMRFRVEAFRDLMSKAKSPLNCMHLARQILLKLEGEQECLSLFVKLILSLCQQSVPDAECEERLNEAYFLIIHKKLKLLLPEEDLQKCIAAYIIASLHSSRKHQVNGETLLLQLLDSQGKPQTEKEASELIDFILAQLADIHDSSANFSRKLAPHLDSVLALIKLSERYSALLQLFEHLLNLKVVIPINDESVNLLATTLKTTLKEGPAKVAFCERLLSGLKWFTKSQAHTDVQLKLYQNLIEALLKAQKTKNALQWLKRLFTYFAAELEVELTLSWINRLTLRGDTLMEIRELYLMLKGSQLIPRETQNQLLIGLLEILERQGCKDLDQLLLQSASQLSQHRENPLLRKQITTLLAEGTSDGHDKALHLVTAYAILDPALVKPMFQCFIGKISLAPVARICLNWTLLKGIIDENLTHQFWSLVIDRELKPDSPVLITILRTLISEPPTFISEIVSKVVRADLNSFHRRAKLLEALCSLAERVFCPPYELAKRLIFTLDFLQKPQLDLGYKCFSSTPWEIDDLQVILIPFIKRAERLSQAQLEYIESLIFSLFDLSRGFSPLVLDLFGHLLTHQQYFRFEGLELAANYIINHHPQAKEYLRHKIKCLSTSGEHHLILRLMKATGDFLSEEERLIYISVASSEILFCDTARDLSHIRLANEVVNREIQNCSAKEAKRSFTGSRIPFMLLPMTRLETPFYAHESILRLQESFFQVSLIDTLPKEVLSSDLSGMREEEVFQLYAFYLNQKTVMSNGLEATSLYPEQLLNNLFAACKKDPEEYFAFHFILIEDILKRLYNHNFKNENLFQIAKQTFTCLLMMGSSLTCYKEQFKELLTRFMFWGALSTPKLFQQHQDFLKNILSFVIKNNIELDVSMLALYTCSFKSTTIKHENTPHDSPLSASVAQIFHKIHTLLRCDDATEPQFSCFSVHALDLFTYCFNLQEVVFSPVEFREVINLIMLGAIQTPFTRLEKQPIGSFLSRQIASLNPAVESTYFFSIVIQLFMKMAIFKHGASRTSVKNEMLDLNELGQSDLKKRVLANEKLQLISQSHIFLKSSATLRAICERPFENSKVSREICQVVLAFISDLAIVANLELRSQVFLDHMSLFFKHFNHLHLESDNVLVLLNTFDPIEFFNWEEKKLPVSAQAQTCRTSSLLVWLKCMIMYYDSPRLKPLLPQKSHHPSLEEVLGKDFTTAQQVTTPASFVLAKKQFYSHIEKAADFFCKLSSKDFLFKTPQACIEYARTHLQKQKGDSSRAIADYSNPENFIFNASKESK